MERIAGLCKAFPYRFVPRLVPTIVTLILLPALLSLGQWQTHRAESKQQLQDSYNRRTQAAPIIVGAEPLDPVKVNYRRVVVRGRYEPAYQILLDNQINQGKAGYQVVTPLHIEGGDMRILVNRGWVVANGDRHLPDIATPQDMVEVTGVVMSPSTHYMELGAVQGAGKEWQKVWQNLDIKRYIKAAQFPVQARMILLDPASPAGGFVRDWPRPDAKVDMHKGYALQWNALALMLAFYYLIVSLRKKYDESQT